MKAAVTGVASRAARRFQRRASDEAVPPPSVRLERQPLPPPPGDWTFDELATAMRTISIDGSAPGEMASYADDALLRFLHTLDLVRGSTGAALELGANPYFITWLLREHTDLDLTLANYFGRPSGTYGQSVELTARGTRVAFDATYDHFNLEAEAFPYADGRFDVVVFCEIIEHLTHDPVGVMREIHRVLAPGGTLVLTTPNVARLGNVLALVEGRNMYDPYSGFGPYGRHNREYNPHELALLLRHCGFEYDRLFTGDAHLDALYEHPLTEQLAPALKHRERDLGQYVFVRAKKVAAPAPGLPSFLYRSYGAGEIVSCE